MTFGSNKVDTIIVNVYGKSVRSRPQYVVPSKYKATSLVHDVCIVYNQVHWMGRSFVLLKPFPIDFLTVRARETLNLHYICIRYETETQYTAFSTGYHKYEHTHKHTIYVVDSCLFLHSRCHRRSSFGCLALERKKTIFQSSQLSRIFGSLNNLVFIRWIRNVAVLVVCFAAVIVVFIMR